MDNLIVFTVSFIIVFIVFLAIHFNKKRRGELANSKEISMLISKFGLKRKYLNYEALGLVFALVNSLIIALVGTLVSSINWYYIWALALGFVLLMFLLYGTYYLIGYLLKRKENKNGKNK